MKEKGNLKRNHDNSHMNYVTKTSTTPPLIIDGIFGVLEGDDKTSTVMFREDKIKGLRVFSLSLREHPNKLDAPSTYEQSKEDFQML